jgi:hypothetical protein
MVDQIADLFHTTHKVKTQQVIPLVLDLRIVHDRFGSSSDPSLNGNLHYPDNIDGSLNETGDDKIRKYRDDYNNNPPNTVSLIPDITSMSGRLHSEFVRLSFLQTHRETDRFFAASGVELVQHDRDQFHFLHVTFSQQLRIDLALLKVSALRITLNLDGVSITFKSHTHEICTHHTRKLLVY